jgi:hypothetical protein
VRFRGRGLALLCAAYTVPGFFFVLIHFLNRKAGRAGRNSGREGKAGAS